MYVCTKCHSEKEPSMFGGWPRNKWCKACASSYQKALRASGYVSSGRNKALAAMSDPAYEKRLRRALVDARRNAKKRGIVFALQRQDLPNNTVCAISGLPLSSDLRSPWIASIDRIDSAIGYVPGNVQLVCWAVNRAKGDLTPADLSALCKALGSLAQD